MRYLKLYETFNDIEVKIAQKNEINFNLFKNQFPDIPISFEQYLQRPHIMVSEAKLDNKVVGASLFVVKDSRPNFKEIAIPIDVDYKLPRIHMNYTAVLEKYRKMGIGKALKLSVMDYAKSIGAGIITSNIKVDNIASQNLSLSCGWLKGGTNSNGAYTFYKVLN